MSSTATTTMNEEVMQMLKMFPNSLTPASNNMQERKGAFKHFVKRADTEKLKAVFLKYASIERNGIHYMTPRDFICKFLGIMPPPPSSSNSPTTLSNTTTTAAASTSTTTAAATTAAATATTTAATTTTTGADCSSGVYDEDTIMLLANVVDTTNDGLISFNEFQAFEGCLVQPDSIYALAFRIFDKNSNGYISFDEFFDVLCKTELHKRIPFDFDSSFILLHFGKDKKKLVSYSEFTKILHDFYEEHALQAFMKYDERMEGFITANQFNDVMLSLKSHLLTDYARDNLLQVVSGGTKKLHSKHISYSYFTAFISLLNNMELIKQIYISGAKNNLEAGLTREELLHEAQKYTQVTPLEIDILFQLISVKNQTGKIFFQDIRKLAPLDTEMLPIHYQDQAIADSLAQGRGILIQIMESAYRFTLGSVAGATGATAVYPIDLVKTRLQNQRTASYIGERMYKNSFDCFKKVLRHEGFFGLYRGLLPQIVGVAPEKAIKLTVNDFVRDKTTSADGKIPLWGEIMAGCSAGACQVIFTNPLEIVKIRLQVAGEIATSRKLGAIEVVKDLGYLGLYKGAAACLLRDIPFSGIFFPLYAHIKSWSANKDGYNNIPSLLFSATVSGAPAAALCTPADVIKTRLQVVARKGQTTYNGIIDCARKVYAEEGFKAFWKGAPARVFRSSPQFGVTLATYELLQRLLKFDFGGRQLAGSSPSGHSRPKHHLAPKNPDHIGGYRLALAAFDGMETKFGLCFPKFKKVQQ